MENVIEATENIQREAEIVARKPDLSLLSAADFPDYEDLAPQPKAEETIKEEPIVEKTEEATNDLTLGEEKIEEKPEEVKLEVAEEVIEQPLTLDGDQNEPEEGSWKALAKLDNIELADDSYEAYKEALTKPLIDKLAAVDNKKMEDYFVDIDPEIRMKIELNRAGMSLQEIDAPLQNIAKFQAMSDVELYREDLMMRYPQATQEWIDSDVEKAVENGQAVHESTRIRFDLENAKNGIVQDRENIIEKYRVNKDNFLVSKRNEEVASVTKAMNDMSTLMGKSIPEDIRKQLGVNYSKGEYDQLLKDPKAIAEFIAYTKLGQQISKNIEAESYSKGKLEITKKLHNIPPVETGGAARSTVTHTEGKGPLDKLTAADFER